MAAARARMSSDLLIGSRILSGKAAVSGIPMGNRWRSVAGGQEGPAVLDPLAHVNHLLIVGGEVLPATEEGPVFGGPLAFVPAGAAVHLLDHGLEPLEHPVH